MSLRHFVRAGQWAINPRHLIAVQDLTASVPGPGGGDRLLMFLKPGMAVELSGQDAAEMRRCLGWAPARVMSDVLDSHDVGGASPKADLGASPNTKLAELPGDGTGGDG